MNGAHGVTRPANEAHLKHTKANPHFSQAAQIADRAERRSVTGFADCPTPKPVTDRRSA
jgi:hypothetical protein